jgi:hypothetical protein
MRQDIPKSEAGASSSISSGIGANGFLGAAGRLTFIAVQRMQKCKQIPNKF